MKEPKKTYNPDSEADVKEAQRKSEIDELNMEAALKKVLSDRSGQMVLAYILGECNVCSKTTFTGNSQTFFNEGRRSVGLDLMAWITKTDTDKASELLVKSVKGEF